MAIRIVTNIGTLLRKVKALAYAKKHSTPSVIAQVQADYDTYYALCLQSDNVMLDSTVGNLYG